MDFRVAPGILIEAEKNGLIQMAGPQFVRLAVVCGRTSRRELFPQVDFCSRLK